MVISTKKNLSDSSKIKRTVYEVVRVDGKFKTIFQSSTEEIFQSCRASSRSKNQKIEN